METSLISKHRMILMRATGEIDHHSAKAYIDAISVKIEVYLPRECILDFQQVSFMDSSGIAVVINALRNMTKIKYFVEKCK